LGDDSPVHDESTVGFGIIDLVAKFRLVGRRFATTDDLRVRLKQTHHFSGGRNRLAVQYSPHRLRDGLLDQRNELSQLLCQTLGLRIG